MEPHQLILAGVVIGFAIAAPMGPVAVFCVRHTLLHGFSRGLAVGLGSAFADSVYAALAIFGVNWIASYLADHQNEFRFIGAVLLGIFGVRAIMAERISSSKDASDEILIPAAILTGFILTMANPMVFIVFGLSFAASGIAQGVMVTTNGLLLAGAVWVGALAWWFTLSSTVSLLRGRFNPDRLLWVNRLAGAILIAFALFLVTTIIFPDILVM